MLIPCLGVVLLLLRPRSHENEPQYQGHSLSHWLLLSLSQRENANKALIHIDTNALPFLLKWIRYERPRWRARLADAIPWGLQGTIRPMIFSQSDFLAAASTDAFKHLGTNGVAAIPELTTLMQDTNAPQTAVRAMRALWHLGTNGLPPLVAAVQDPRYPLHFWAAVTLLIRPSTTESVSIITPVAIQYLSDTTDPRNALLAARELGLSRHAPDLSIPALTNCLTPAAASEQLRNAAAHALGEFGQQATNALPALTNALTDPSPVVRRAATNALNRIRPQPLTKTVPQ